MYTTKIIQFISSVQQMRMLQKKYAEPKNAIDLHLPYDVVAAEMKVDKLGGELINQPPDIEQYKNAAMLASNLTSVPCNVVCFNNNTCYRIETDVEITENNPAISYYLRGFNNWYENSSGKIKGGSTKMAVFGDLIAAMVDFYTFWNAYGLLEPAKHSEVKEMCMRANLNAAQDIQKEIQKRLREN